MCESDTKSGGECTRPSAFWVHVLVMPQTHTMPDGETFTESFPAGRGNTVCSTHLVAKVRELHALDIRLAGESVQVKPL